MVWRIESLISRVLIVSERGDVNIQIELWFMLHKVIMKHTINYHRCQSVVLSKQLNFLDVYEL